MTERSKRGERARGGFTLIEVLLVVAILGILAGVVVVNLAGRGEKAAIAAARASIGSIVLAIDVYEVDTGKLPSGLQSLVSSDGSPNWNGPYFKTALKDPWGHDFAYQREGDRGYKVISGGPDGSVGGADDITSF